MIILLNWQMYYLAEYPGFGNSPVPPSRYNPWSHWTASSPAQSPGVLVVILLILVPRQLSTWWLDSHPLDDLCIDIWTSAMVICLSTQIAERQGTAMCYIMTYSAWALYSHFVFPTFFVSFLVLACWSWWWCWWLWWAGDDAGYAGYGDDGDDGDGGDDELTDASTHFSGQSPPIRPIEPRVVGMIR